ncbi:MAG: putative glycoside hydrolase, partial [Bacteroidales bacterium]|nr:putative glycoside hydrolase [Bacteroidales bacterium]
NWLKVSFKDEEGKEIIGWINAKNASKDWTGLISEKYQDMDYTSQKKIKEYENNPRVKVRGVYVTIWSASNARIDSLIEMSKRTKINTFVIDVKDDNGYMLFKTKAAEKFSPKANEKATVKDIQALMKKLKDNNIYTIARIVSFKDPTYTSQNPEKAIIYKDTGKPFMNKDGLIWASPHDRTLWEYNLEVSKEAAEVGFNEIQFDYVRFPASDGGKLDKHLDYRNETGESKPGTIQNYLKYAREQLSPKKVYISADVYGLVGSVEDDMSRGQYWEAVSNIVDYISPMMYPSHYANNTYGIPIPDTNPYGTVYHSTKDSVIRNKNMPTPGIIRPWIQDFTAPWVKGYIKYSDKQVIEQIKALEENGVDEYLLWNAGNKYSEGAVTK